MDANDLFSVAVRNARDEFEHEHVWDAWSRSFPNCALFHGTERRYCACGAFQSQALPVSDLLLDALASHDARVKA